jgi:hypothetical protein
MNTEFYEMTNSDFICLLRDCPTTDQEEIFNEVARRISNLERQRDEARGVAIELRDAMPDLVRIAEHYCPPKAHEGSCGPWSSCDGSCMDNYYIETYVEKANKALAIAKELL